VYRLLHLLLLFVVGLYTY